MSSENTAPINASLQPIWVDDAARATDVLQTYAQRDVVAIDTEFMRTVTFYPVPAVMQVGDSQAQYLLAAEAIDSAAATQFFTDLEPHSTIVVHAAREDMEVFTGLSGLEPSNVFDTQIAAGFVGMDPTLSLQNIIEQLLGVALAKTESRTNWLQRPLTDEQIDYAAADIAYLLDVYDVLKQKLDANGRLDWVLEDCQKRLRIELPEPELYYLGYNNAWQLSEAQLIQFQQTIAWREHYARTNDVARTRIAKDGIVFHCVRTGAQTKSDLRKAGMHPQAVRKYGDALLDVLTRPVASDASALAAVRQPLSKAEQQLVKKLRKRIAVEADALGISPQVIASTKHCTALLYWYLEQREQSVDNAQPVPELFTGWRYERVTQPCLALLDDALRS